MDQRSLMLRAVKTFHTIAWLVIEACMAYVLYTGITGRNDRKTRAAAVVVAGESLIFAATGFQCPLTVVAQNLGDGSGSVTDIYLPRWFARYPARDPRPAHPRRRAAALAELAETGGARQRAEAFARAIVRARLTPSPCRRLTVVPPAGPLREAAPGARRTVRKLPGLRVILESSGAGTVAPEEFMAGSKRRG